MIQLPSAPIEAGRIIKASFSAGLPEPNGVSGRCLCCYIRPPTFLIWNNLCDLVYQNVTDRQTDRTEQDN